MGTDGLNEGGVLLVGEETAFKVDEDQVKLFWGFQVGCDIFEDGWLLNQETAEGLDGDAVVEHGSSELDADWRNCIGDRHLREEFKEFLLDSLIECAIKLGLIVYLKAYNLLIVFFEVCQIELLVILHEEVEEALPHCIIYEKSERLSLNKGLYKANVVLKVFFLDCTVSQKVSLQ